MARDPASGRVAPALAVVALLVACSTTASAQSVVTYVSIVDQYARGDATGALNELARWTPAATTTASTDRPRFMPADRQRAAVMLHTDLAYASMLAGVSANTSLQLGAARRILAIMKGGGRGDERTRTFEQRWFAFVASMFTSHGQLDSAEVIVRDGLTMYPRDALLHVARGCILEMTAELTLADPGSGGQVSHAARLLEAASADYRRAIEFDDTLAAAYLHLGWVRFTGRDDRSARDFASALERATDDTTRYLAHLFLGASAERLNRLEDARREYEAAMAAGPRYQTAFIALGRAEEALGRAARAQELAREYAALPDKREDPWWDYHLGGFDQPTLDWLRREARSP